MAAEEPAEPPAIELAVQMSGRLVVVVGGGRTAERAVGRLLAANARVLVVAPELSAGIADLAARGDITARRRAYQASDLDAAWLVLTCGPDDVNARVAGNAEARRIWAASVEPGTAGPQSAVLLAESADLAGAAPDPGGATQADAKSDRERNKGRKILVLGGARSGKSATAESMLADAPVVDYVATGQRAGIGDEEWDQRVRDHQARRPPGWRTLETCDLASLLRSSQSAGPVLIDCLATWLAQVMDECGLWSGDSAADARLAGRIEGFVAAWQQTRRQVIVVSNEVGCGVVPATSSGRRFRDELGWLNARIAGASEEVWFCTAGLPRRLQ